LEEIAGVTEADSIPALLQRIAAAYGMKTLAYLGTGTLDRKDRAREPYFAATCSPSAPMAQIQG